MQKKTISLLLFHGSARNDAIVAAEKFLVNLRRTADNAAVSMCFLRGQQPDLPTALENLVIEGYGEVRLIPLFLLPGAHVNEDIPGMIEAFCKKHPEITVKTLPCLVEIDDFIRMLAKIIQTND